MSLTDFQRPELQGGYRAPSWPEGYTQPEWLAEALRADVAAGRDPFRPQRLLLPDIAPNATAEDPFPEPPSPPAPPPIPESFQPFMPPPPLPVPSARLSSLGGFRRPSAPGSIAGFRPQMPAWFRGLSRSPYARFAAGDQGLFAQLGLSPFQPALPPPFDEEELRRRAQPTDLTSLAAFTQ